MPYKLWIKKCHGMRTGKCVSTSAIVVVKVIVQSTKYNIIAHNVLLSILLTMLHTVFTFWNSSLVFKSPWMLLSAFKCQANSAILHSAKLQCNVVSLCSNCIILTVSVTAHSLPKKCTLRKWSRKTTGARMRSFTKYLCWNLVQKLCGGEAN